ncbi:MAG: cell division protein FtsQ/DivIB [Candidatus Dormibacteraceae bacterium]
MRSRRPRGLEGYTPDWREKAGAQPPRKRSLRIPKRRRRPGRVPREEIRAPEDPSTRRRRHLALVLAFLEGGLLIWLLAGPALPVRTVRVDGLRHLRAGEVVAAAGLARPGSILRVDGRAIRGRLGRIPWVRAALVSTSLPGTVVITIDEWNPAATYQAGPTGKPVFLNDEGQVLGPGAGTAAPFGIQGPAGPDPGPGARPVDPMLLTAMINIQKALPGLIGLSVKAYAIDAAGNLSLDTNRGWPVQFGRVLTPEQFHNLDEQLAALKSVSACVDFRTAPIKYVNVMNPSAPDVQFRTAGPRPCRP